MKILFSLLFVTVHILTSQDIHTEYLVVEGDTLDVFSYQIPEGYSPDDPLPLLVAFHQWGGNENSPYYTEFDDEANNRSWFFMSPYGGSSNNYNHQDAQAMVEGEILWMMDNFSIDSNRIYMVGGSMGGAAGSIYANNHLDPTLPMVAATASGSGILDCERRYWEMEGNNSMIEWFGGTPEEVPFEYHRNSAVFFEDSTQSMHYNLQHTPLYLDFGSTEAHRYHAEDLYNLLFGYNDNMWIDTIPSGGHGYSVMHENHTCDWLSQFTLVDDPDYINVNLDEPSRVYWTEAIGYNDRDEFIRLITTRYNSNWFELYEFENSDSVIFHNSIVNTDFNEILLDNHVFSRDFKIGLTGDDFNSLTSIVALGNVDDLFESLVITIDNDNSVVWIWLPDWGFVWEFIGIEMTFDFEDVSQDGVWNILDIVLTGNFILDLEEPDEYQLGAADLNDDAGIDILDIILMVNLILE
ncbi:MAG: dockerin type I repeat-containing protein [Candidatus Marinimicrobia bacterium]|nr:hypothetical protein [Candidatus Neomarinimicrobiota bacterium]MBL7023619.1 dockerin type I repeat-containing protein [Candidatus Neomarinimicrobiota bacterium]MBL7109806.1 dockerin type I repeat-containing protein [Candidatus Neomarinimicrobiota bacterium]